MAKGYQTRDSISALSFSVFATSFRALRDGDSYVHGSIDTRLLGRIVEELRPETTYVPNELAYITAKCPQPLQEIHSLQTKSVPTSPASSFRGLNIKILRRRPLDLAKGFHI